VATPLVLEVPTYSWRWFGANEHCTDPADADMLLVDHGTDTSRFIKAGEWLLAHTTQPALKKFTWLDHAAVVRWRDGVPVVSEMGPRGHELRPLETYEDCRYCVVHFDAGDESRQRALAYDESCWAAKYGWFQYVGFLVNGLTATKFSFGWGDNLICSTHVSMVMKGLGLFADRPDESVMPMHLAWYVEAAPPPKST
jgi:hypothetical protein